MKRFFALIASVLSVFLVVCAGLVLISEIRYPAARKAEKTVDTEGLYFSVLGDSISTYQGYTPDGYPMDPYYSPEDFDVESMWWSVLAEQTGMIPCVINAVSGTGVTELFPDEDISTAGNGERSEQLHTDENTPDVIFVLLGGNDALRHVSADNIQESYVEMLERIKKAYPEAQVYACTYYLMPGVLKEWTGELNDLIRKSASMAGVSCIDVEECAVSSGNPEEFFADYDAEAQYGLHVNRRGQEILGNAVVQAFEEAIRSD